MTDQPEDSVERVPEAVETKKENPEEWKRLVPPHIDYGNPEGFFYWPARVKDVYCVTLEPIPPCFALRSGSQIELDDETIFRTFQNAIRQKFCQKGMGLPVEFHRFRVPKAAKPPLEKIFAKARDDPRCSLVFVMRDGYDSYHGFIKLLEHKYDVPTVHLSYQTVFRMFTPPKQHLSRAVDSEDERSDHGQDEVVEPTGEFDEDAVVREPNAIVRSVVRKVNTKLGGLNYRVVTDKETKKRIVGGELYIGINMDYYDIHSDQLNGVNPSIGRTIEIMGYAANDLVEASAFTGNYLYAMKTPMGTMNGLLQILTEVVGRFRVNRRQDPTAVYVFLTVRDCKNKFALRIHEKRSIREHVRGKMGLEGPVHFVAVKRIPGVFDETVKMPKPGTVLSFESHNAYMHELRMISHWFTPQNNNKEERAREIVYRFDLQPAYGSRDAEAGDQSSLGGSRFQAMKSGANAVPVETTGFAAGRNAAKFDENQNEPVRGFGVSGLRNQSGFGQSGFRNVQKSAEDQQQQPTPGKFGSQNTQAGGQDGEQPKQSAFGQFPGQPVSTPVNFKTTMDDETWENVDSLPWKLFALSHCHQLINRCTRMPAPLVISAELAKRGHMMLCQTLYKTELLKGQVDEVLANLNSYTYKEKKLRNTRFNA